MHGAYQANGAERRLHGGVAESSYQLSDGGKISVVIKWTSMIGRAVVEEVFAVNNYGLF